MLIFTPTIPHTGTWFLLEFFKRCGLACNFVRNILTKSEPIAEPGVLHTHILTQNELTFDLLGVDPSRCAFTVDYHLPFAGVIVLANLFKTVIPIRDPAAALLTRESRRPELRHFFVVRAFIDVAQRLADNKNIKFFPIDVGSYDFRKKLLTDTLVHCGIKPGLHAAVIEKTAKSWKRENLTPNNRFIEHYKSKDVDKIRGLLGPKCAEIEYLKNNSTTIFPFMSKLGYTKADLFLW